MPDEAGTVLKLEMYGVFPALLVDFNDPEYDRKNLRLGTVGFLCMDPKTGHEDPFRMAHILNDGWIEFRRKLMRGFVMAQAYALPVRSIDGEAFCCEMWQELKKSLSVWCGTSTTVMVYSLVFQESRLGSV